MKLSGIYLPLHLPSPFGILEVFEKTCLQFAIVGIFYNVVHEYIQDDPYDFNIIFFH